MLALLASLTMLVTAAPAALAHIDADIEAGRQAMLGDWFSCEVACSRHGPCSASMTQPTVALTFSEAGALLIHEIDLLTRQAQRIAAGAFEVTTVEYSHWRHSLKRVDFDAALAGPWDIYSAHVGSRTDNGYRNIYIYGLHTHHARFCRFE